MNLYYLSQRATRGYDTYDSAVVAARNEEEAKAIHPSWSKYSALGGFFQYGTSSVDWATHVDQVDCELLGKAKPMTEVGPILASFNAG